MLRGPVSRRSRELAASLYQVAWTARGHGLRTLASELESRAFWLDVWAADRDAAAATTGDRQS